MSEFGGLAALLGGTAKKGEKMEKLPGGSTSPEPTASAESDPDQDGDADGRFKLAAGDAMSALQQGDSDAFAEALDACIEMRM